jgi:hypothetical protein
MSPLDIFCTTWTLTPNRTGNLHQLKMSADACFHAVLHDVEFQAPLLLVSRAMLSYGQVHAFCKKLSKMSPERCSL